MKRVDEYRMSQLIYPGSLSLGWENKTDILSSVVLSITAGPVQFLEPSVGALGVRRVRCPEIHSVTKLTTGTSP